MKFVKLSVFALLLLSVACTNDLNDSDSLVNQQEHVDSQYKAIFFYGEIWVLWIAYYKNRTRRVESVNQSKWFAWYRYLFWK